MIINAASSFIGILTLMGAKYRIEGDWAWIDHLKDYQAILGAILFGGLTAVLTCIYLFEVQVRGSFHKIYPNWLLAGNGLFLTSAAAAIFLFWRHRQESGKLMPELESGTRNNRTTALLWVMSPLAILISINLLVMWVAVERFEFR